MLSATPLEGLPEVTPGLDLGAAIVTALARWPVPERAQPGDVLVIAHKIVSKAEGRTRRLAEVTASERAVELAAGVRDPRLVQVALEESRGVVRAAPGVIVCETHHGFVCANAGVDQSNVPGEHLVLMLPLDPDASARRIRARLRELTGSAPGVVITDSFGRAWRTGQVDVTIGLAGVAALDDWRGRTDKDGRELRATVIAVADLLAATADLARRKDAAQPVVLIRGAGEYVTDEDGPGVRPLLRERAQDLFR
ncbi:coenzyme F420-0:L-glutamate ligase [Conexibacter sp. S30A1]|uniref:coenzyme F420-0:L-glutamate ligase n=1 Tax=Conexibacter sp. S30A1 TaxID=2937800 RepID=UPI0020101F48|nr:coenzyme F420-0:L-glutamate ligase [Conexibacter sp. S30A1]